MIKLDHSALRFALVGISNTVVGLSTTFVAWRLGAGDVLANALGYAVGIGWSFAINRLWTFDAKGPVARSFPRFLLVCAVGYLANLGVLLALRPRLGGDSFMPQLLAMVTYTVIGYLGSRYFVFVKPETDGYP